MCDIKELEVMVVDSNLKTQNEFCEALRKVGLLKLECATNSIEAVIKLNIADREDSIFSLVFCNMGNNFNDVKKLVNIIRQDYPDTIPIMYSYCKNPEAPINAIIAGSMDLINMGDSYRHKFIDKINRWTKVGQLRADKLIGENNGR